MKITITKNEREFDITAAWRIIGQMLEKQNAVIGLSTGETTGGMHKVVSEIHTSHPFDVSNITIFNVDEITGLDRHFIGSCFAMIESELVKNIGVLPENFIMPDPMAEDLDKECRDFQAALENRGGIDLQMLGIGLNGHIGINQPHTPFESETYVAPMDELFEQKLRAKGEIASDTKMGGITLGIKNIMQIRKIVLIAKGKQKASIIKQAFFGPITTDIPASILQLHPNCEVLLDADAASEILDLI